jgi:hypothetical protein
MAVVRVVRFTGVSPDRIDEMKERIDSNDAPPEGVDSTGITVLADRDQGTAVVIQHFEDEEKMRTSEAALEAMDPSDTPGTRASIDRCEVIAEVSV